MEDPKGQVPHQGHHHGPIRRRLKYRRTIAGAGRILRPEVVATVALPVLAGSRDDAAEDPGGLYYQRGLVSQ